MILINNNLELTANTELLVIGFEYIKSQPDLAQIIVIIFNNNSDNDNNSNNNNNNNNNNTVIIEVILMFSF